MKDRNSKPSHSREDVIGVLRYYSASACGVRAPNSLLDVAAAMLEADSKGVNSTHTQRPRLTPEEIKELEHETDMKSSLGEWASYFARAIERKVRGEA